MKSLLSTLALTLTASLVLLGPGCTFGDTSGDEDAGQDALDGASDDGDSQQPDNAEPEPPTYPPPPYGTHIDETIANLSMEEVDCEGTPSAHPWKMEEFLGAKAIMISVHAGWCTYCKQEAETLMADYVRPYASQGLKVAVVLFQDSNPNVSTPRDTLITFACGYKDRYDLTIPVLIDTGAAVMGDFFSPTEAGTPLNMLIGEDMTIRIKIEGFIEDITVLRGTIEALLSE